MASALPHVTAENLMKIYRRGAEEIRAVNDVSLSIGEGEFVAFTGPSGSGKTTLINILGCLDNPTSGRLSIGERSIFGDGAPLGEGMLTDIRRDIFGYVFQKFYLIPTLTVRENVMLPFVFFKKMGAEAEVENILRLLGLDKRRNHLPGQISGGEMQRVAIARALVNKPRVLLADEPTGNLDSATSEEILNLLESLNRSGKTIIMVTHEPDVGARARHPNPQ
ncbi:MAG: ABC transporter ATP-binding protein [Chitinivibrionia bacterium]|nr:ABC transporter ATP-binding protein [Chitinivibrionia bacterium]